ncbi:hypothetical protein CEXT_194541 [Caerostris extrusa]|uniref:Uncharacterized protein n=1 Tax=Caerostris extrusa TaxID=172846 RepID=A0AAV4MQA2_CAEEX|nr:hypothetical protein CEXT_194541 [Caerostris extrusa]
MQIFFQFHRFIIILPFKYHIFQKKKKERKPTTNEMASVITKSVAANPTVETEIPKQSHSESSFAGAFNFPIPILLKLTETKQGGDQV